MSKSNIHNLLRKRFYTGDFDWKGETYRGSHEPLISTGLFERVQEILDGRHSTKQKVTKHEFTFSGPRELWALWLRTCSGEEER